MVGEMTMFKSMVMLRVLLLVLIALSSSARAAEVSQLGDGRTGTPLNSIVVRLDPLIFGDAQAVVAAVGQGDPPTLQALGNPIEARLLLSVRVLPQFLSMMARDDPRIGLHEAVVLRYADGVAADIAESILSRTQGVNSWWRDVALAFATPNDPLLPSAGSPTQWQWGADRLNLVAAWDRVRGTAYAALLDNGIQIHGFSNAGVHPDLVSNYRPQFSRNLDSYNGPNGTANTAGNLDEEPYTVTISGTTYTNIAGHGTHTAGILAATANNSIGVAGTCQQCSLMLGRVSTYSGSVLVPSMADVATGVALMASSGAGVINNSFGSTGTPPCTYPGAPGSVCAALDAANTLDVIVAAAAGNGQSTTFDFPASYVSVIPVGGAEYDASGAKFWVGTSSPVFGSNYNTSLDLIAGPAKDVISSVYTGTDWNSSSPYNCGDNFPASFATGYGDCTGTSMATPFISGVLALIRSARPTLNVSAARTILYGNTTACVGTLASQCGHGLPDVNRAVAAALGGPSAINRLTPLFSFYSSDRQDHFYSVFPQMGAAAILGTLLPVTFNGNQFSYGAIGPLSPGFSLFAGVPLTGCGFSPPCDPLYPRALLSVFTTFRNPISGGPELVPLYRLSWACPNTSCSNQNKVSHVYSADLGESWTASGYKVDGIEGYIFPRSTSPQPRGTVRVCRKYDSSRDDYILFPGAGSTGSDCSATTDGYSGGSYASDVLGCDWIGWAYKVRPPQAICGDGVPCDLQAMFLFDD